jgi:hypothetical protein
MNHLSISRRVLGLAFVFGCGAEAPKLATTTDPIHNGTAISNYRQVFSVATDSFSFGSATNVRYPRCLVSAAHVGNIGLVLTGDDANAKSQDAGFNRVRPEWAGNLGKLGVWIDLRVAWAANKQSTADKKRIVEPDDYDPRTPVQTLGLASTEVDPTTTQPKGPQFDPPPAAWLQGYGENKNGAGLGVLREGLNFILWYAQGSQQPTPRVGSFYITQGENACNGDSGGPAFFEDGSYFGVISQGRGNDCETVDLTGVTGFDTGAPTGQVSNYDWLNKTIEEACSKVVDVCADVGGRIDGTLSPSPLVVEDVVMNGKISCSWDPEAAPEDRDCTEYLHGQSPDRAAQTLTLTASAEAGYHFVKWTGSDPCNNSMNATCVVPYAKVGTYDADTSNDTSGYTAVFEADAPAPLPGPMPVPMLGGAGINRTGSTRTFATASVCATAI